VETPAPVPNDRPVTGDVAAAHAVLGPDDLTRITSRMAHQLLEKTSGAPDTVLLGIPTRGIVLAHRIAQRIEDFEGLRLPVGQLDPTMYRDDLRLRSVRPLEATSLPGDGSIDGRTVVLVDDVLFSGRTVRAALDALSDLGRPRAVHLAVLVDRGHRELPIRADYVGKNLPTSRNETVHVLLRETDGRDEVLLGPAHRTRPQATAERDGEDR
jgi:pyrimidine operon attenuation protein / uracil phosphoribosyltransferase